MPYCQGIIGRIGGLAFDFSSDKNKGHWCSNAKSDETDSPSEPDHQDDQSTRLLVAQENGVVKWYDPHRGYGFLVRPDGSELFVHRQRVVMAAGEAPLLRARTQLSFDVWRSPHGRLEAQNVRTTWGRPISNRVSGKRYSLIHYCPPLQMAARSRCSSRKIKEPRRHCTDGKS
ncbi:Y-box factor homolog isoform X2 [Varroa jacobsoni]|uniref:CSD domain-containing protein n=1 Tax=Varroa destructor TaxID=109461 RepID=A0A7M7JBB1_VARDE|nr:Y-box factor homolog isoform X2 [Varroa destructor]XP_022710116.1 Y-box factor homolog isoform X2 [Varroa jacobsoni]